MGSTTSQQRSSLLVGRKQPPHTAALETVLLACSSPSLEGAPSGPTEPSEAHVGFCDKKGTCGFFFLTLYFDCTHVFNPGAQG